MKAEAAADDRATIRGDPLPATAPVAVVNFMNYEGWEWGKIAAGGTMVMLPVLLLDPGAPLTGARPDRRRAQGVMPPGSSAPVVLTVCEN